MEKMNEIGDKELEELEELEELDYNFLHIDEKEFKEINEKIN